MHHVESELFPRFRESPSFALYTDMQYFAFSREPLTRASFKWLRVSCAAPCTVQRAAEAECAQSAMRSGELRV